MALRVLCLLSLLAPSVCLQASVAHASRAASPFALVSGATAPQEMCLVADSGAVLLEKCAAAIARGKGQELWQLQASGKLVSVASGLCAAAVGADVTLSGCDAVPQNGSQWEATGSGQFKLSSEDLCLTQRGPSLGVADLAPAAAASASSTSNIAHGASKAVDSEGATFWASEFDVKGPVSFTLDLGTSKRVQDLEIVWAYPAKAFTVSVSDGGAVQQVFSTASNILPVTRLELSKSVKAVTIEMTEHHSVLGVFEGHALYGITSISALGLQSETAVKPCAEVAKSTDARDKYFMIYAEGFDPSPANALASEAPSLEAAQASLATVVTDLADALPQMSACKSKTMSLVGGALHHATRQLSVAGGSASDLVAQARSTIEAAREVLAK